MINIAIVGVGALGSRHLQALARLAGPMRVDLLDPSSSALARARDLLCEVGGLNGEVRYAAQINGLACAPDLAIIATNARERMPAVQKLCTLGCPALIIEKVLFTRREDYALAGEAIRSAGTNAWVNCSRRTAPRFHRLQELLAGRPISYRVDGYNWGLACNVIHHLDEWLALTPGSTLELSGRFEPELVPSRRDGYYDVTGTISGIAGDSSFFARSALGKSDGPPGDRAISIDCEDLSLRIGQASQKMEVRVRGQLVSTESYPTAMQSEATAWHIATILAGGEPPLPRFEESARLHLAMLDVLMPHFQSIDSSLTECPIT